MQTLILQVRDSFVPNLLNILSQFKNEVKIKDKNLEYDPYFYERKQDLEQIILDSENGQMELLSQEQYDNEMRTFFQNLKFDENI
jgi:anthranilate/para-aminobenzoate synthase component II